MPDWFVEVDYRPSKDRQSDHQDWHCKEYERSNFGLLLRGTSVGHELVFIPFSDVRSIAFSEAAER